jgi:3-methyl-2-oxobutanoate hydroxymethyltransferase
LKKVTIHTLRKMKQSGERITMLTAYDATFAGLFDRAEIDALLVGDSLGMVVQGHRSTLPVTLDQMVYHCACVARGASRAHLVGDLPFGTYQGSADEAVRAAVRIVAEGGMEAVKLEGGADYAEVVARIVRAGVPVMGHIGLTPQSVHKLGGYVVQGRTDEKAERLVADARALEDAGCYALVLEAIPAPVAIEVTRALSIPTIGIGAGAGCDGQVLVSYDLLGMNPDFAPKFVKRFADLAGIIGEAVAAYRDEVREGSFPALEHTFSMEKGPERRPGPPARVVMLPLPGICAGLSIHGDELEGAGGIGAQRLEDQMTDASLQLYSSAGRES